MKKYKGKYSLGSQTNYINIDAHDVFGSETEKLFELCQEAFELKLSHSREWNTKKDFLLRKIYGIAKRHGVYIKWYGLSSVCCPDRWLVMRDQRDIGMIQL